MHALPEFILRRPETMAEAATLLATESSARLIAGGTDLLPNMRRGLACPAVVIDLSGVSGFDAVEALADGGAVLGAGLTLAGIAADPTIASRWPALADAARAAAGPGHRSAATLGGNLCQDTRCVFYNQSEWWRASNQYCLKRGGETCHVAPQGKRCHAAFSGDLAPVLLALGAHVELQSTRGTHWLPLDELYRDDGAAHLTLEPGELLVRVRLPAAAPGLVCGYRKARVRAAMDFPLAAVAVALVLEQGRVVSLRIALSGTNSHPLSLDGTGELEGQEVDDALLARVAKLVQHQVSPMRSTATPSNYRRQVAAALTQRLLQELANGPGAPGSAAIRAAFEIELGGRAFYQRAAADSADETLKALFSQFAVMEGEHMETLSRRYHVPDIPDPTPPFRVETASLFTGIEYRPHDPDSLFRIAIALEQRAADFFANHAADAATGSAERRLYEELAAEEREHSQVLSAQYQLWRRRTPEAAPQTQAEQINGAALLLAHGLADHTALVCGDQRLSYRELRDRVARAAAVWRARGLKPGDRVAIKLPDGIDWVVAFLGTIWAGGVAVAVNPHIPAPEWHYILDEAGFNVILAESAQDTPSPWCERVILVDEGRHAVANATPIAPQAMGEDSPAFWCHSSGTSGKPKAVVHRHRFAREIERISRERLGITAQDRLFATSRLFFSYPQTNSLFAGLKIGATVILDPQWPTATSVAATVEQMRPSVFFSVPSLYRSLLHAGQAPALAAAGIRTCVSAGEALPASLRQAWREATGIGMVDGYGASETLVLVLTAVDGDEGLRPSPGVQVEPLDPGAASAGIPTRLRFRVSTLALGYLDRPAAQAETFRDGAFCPADLFLRTESGNWRFAGREDSLVKIKGRWVNLVELEERLAAGVPGLLEAGTVCVPDRDGMDSVAFFYVARDGQAAQVEGVLRERAAALPAHQRPGSMHAIEALPRTPTGKLLRRRLAEMLPPIGARVS